MNLRKCVVLAYLLFGVGAGVAMDVTTNVWYNSDWSNDLPWVDLIRQARQWTYTPVVDPGNAYNPWPWAQQGAPKEMMVPVDTDGYPLQIPYTYNGTPYRPVTIVLCQYDIKHYPYGTYTLIFEGKGTIVLGWDAHDTITSATGGVTTHQFNINSISPTFRYDSSTTRGLLLTIMKSDSTDHIRHIHLIMPGFADKWKTQPMNPNWVKVYRPFKLIRYMVWCAAFTTKVSHWKDRVHPTSFNQCGADPVNQAGYSGIADEFICDAANAVQRDAWVCVPPYADSDYIWHMAKIYHDKLDPKLKVWVEWANETWYGVYVGATVCQDSFAAAGVPNRWSYHGVVAARIFKIFRDAFKDDTTRLVKVISGQDNNTGVLSDILTVMNNPKFNPTGEKPDVLAVAPYFGYGITPANFDWVETVNDSLAKKVGAKLVMYEGGNCAGNFTAANNAALITNYNSAFAIFSKYFTTFNQFTCICPGIYGAKKYLDQPIDETGKYKACYDYIVANKQWDPSEKFQPYPEVVSTQKVFPTFNTVRSKLSVLAAKSHIRVAVNDVKGQFTLKVLNIGGRQVALRKGNRNAEFDITAHNMVPGMYEIRLSYEGNKLESKSVVVPLN